MARSKKIYMIVLEKGNMFVPYAAFTVKHECQTWLERNREMLDKSGFEHITILSYVDGGHTMDEALPAFGFEEAVKDISSQFSLDKSSDSDTIS